MGAFGNLNYTPNSKCEWTIESPEAPYINLDFIAFDTEALYDTVTVQVGAGRHRGRL